jgi:DMSO/TMAO reductase YedYZ molybdopterin-dependent catalytic subunit
MSLRRRSCALAVGAALLFGPLAARADVAVSGAVSKPLTLTAAALAAEPQVGIHVAFNTDHGPQSADYTGVLLWTVLQKAGLVAGSAKGGNLRHGILVTGSDGYGALLSVGELNPDFAGLQAILAVTQDGKPIQEGVRLVVPGDKRGGRSVRNVVGVEVQ